MAENCDPNALAAAAKCFKCQAGNLQEIQTYLLCQILNAGGTGGGGGSGTVTSFSSGNLSPLFTTSVATASTTPALSFTAVNQAANLFYVGPAAGGAAAPTFRAMVNADLGTTLTPQFARMGLGVAADAATLLYALRPGGGVGVDAEICRFDVAAGNPFFTIGALVVDNGGFFKYDRSSNFFVIGVHGHPGVNITSASGLTTVGDIETVSGIFKAGGLPGVTQTFDITAPNTTIQFIGGIAVAIA